MKTHNLCFEAKIKIDIPLHTPVCYIKMGYKGVYIHGHVILIMKISHKNISYYQELLSVYDERNVHKAQVICNWIACSRTV